MEFIPQVSAVFIAISGVLITINADFVMQKINPQHQIHTTYENYKTDSVLVKILVAFLAVFANVFWALALLAQKKVPQVPGIKVSFILGWELLITGSLGYQSGMIDSVP